MDDICVMCGEPLAAEGTWVCPACQRDPMRLTHKRKVLRDILGNYPCTIMYRCNGPVGCEDDMLLGYGKWDGKVLTSLDGDYHLLNEVINRYEVDEDYLTVWFEGNWI